MRLYVFIEVIFIEAVFIEAIFIEAIFIKAIFIEAILIEAIFIEAVFIEAIFIEAIFIEGYYFRYKTLYCEILHCKIYTNIYVFEVYISLRDIPRILHKPLSTLTEQSLTCTHVRCPTSHALQDTEPLTAPHGKVIILLLGSR